VKSSINSIYLKRLYLLLLPWILKPRRERLELEVREDMKLRFALLWRYLLVMAGLALAVVTNARRRMTRN